MAGVCTSGLLVSNTMACGSITRKTGKAILSGLMDLGNTKAPSKMTRGMAKVSTLGTTALNCTEVSGVMAKKMVLGMCVITSTLSRKRDFGGATRLSNGYQKTMMTKVKMEIVSSARTS